MPLPRFEKLDEPRKVSILTAAADEFGERGFEGASYNRIIERAGISKGAMYYYFADKDDLFRTVMNAALLQWFEEVGFPMGADTPTAFWQACEGMYVRSLLFVLRDPRNAALCTGITKARAELAGHPVVQQLTSACWSGWARSSRRARPSEPSARRARRALGPQRALADRRGRPLARVTLERDERTGCSEDCGHDGGISPPHRRPGGDPMTAAATTPVSRRRRPRTEPIPAEPRR